MEPGKQGGQREEEEERGSLGPEGAPAAAALGGWRVQPVQTLGFQACSHAGSARPTPVGGERRPFLGSSSLGK